MIQIFNDEMSNLCNFSERDSKLEIVNRQKPAGAAPFFKQLVKSPFWASGELRENNVLNDVEEILGGTISSELQKQAFYEEWVDDMANVATLFCKIEKSNSISDASWYIAKRQDASWTTIRRYQIEQWSEVSYDEQSSFNAVSRKQFQNLI